VGKNQLELRMSLVEAIENQPQGSGGGVDQESHD
jgi:hypothetical protein